MPLLSFQNVQCIFGWRGIESRHQRQAEGDEEEEEEEECFMEG